MAGPYVFNDFICFDHSLDFRDLAGRNRLGRPGRLNSLDAPAGKTLNGSRNGWLTLQAAPASLVFKVFKVKFLKFFEKWNELQLHEGK